MFPKYLTKYQNVKIVKSKFKSEESKKETQKQRSFLKKTRKKILRYTCVTWPCLLILGIRTCEYSLYNSFVTKYI